jgi:threonine/homoserine/homoserine lactone efflux protein
METLLPLLGFVVVQTFTPGPNNLMCLVSGANFGLARTIPHISGIAAGFPIMIVATGFGLGYLFDAWPILHDVLKYVAFAYLLWLAWRIANAGRPKTDNGAAARPLTFIEAAAFQWVNPKAWAIVFAAMALYTTAAGNKVVEIGLIAVLFGLVCFPNGVVWTLFGRAIAGFLDNDVHRRWFNIVMAVLLVASVLPTMV